MKLAYVCTDPGIPVFGNKGGAIHVQSVVRALIARGADVALVARRFGGEPPAGLESVRVHRLSKAPSGQSVERERFLIDANAEVAGVLSRERGLDQVYERHALFSCAAMEYARRADIPGLLEVNAPLIDEQRRFRSLSLVAEAERAADRSFAAAAGVLAVSRALAEWLETRTPAAGRVHVEPNGVDVGRFGAHVCPSRPGEPGIVTIGFVGSLRPWHGVEQLVEAFCRMRRDGAPIRLLVVGDGPMREQIQTACERENGAAVFTGAVSPGMVPGLLASMDVAVAPYPRIDGFYFSPLKLYEYMAAGVGIAASAAGQVREVIEHEHSGLLYEPGDEAALREVLWRLVTDSDLRAQLGARARQEAERHHRWERVADRILSLSRAVKGANV